LLLNAAAAAPLTSNHTQEGMLPIHFAAMFNRLDVVAMLLDRGSLLAPPAAKKVKQSTQLVCSATQWVCTAQPAKQESFSLSASAKHSAQLLLAPT
jgi:ankyrin repeat protein